MTAAAMTKADFDRIVAKLKELGVPPHVILGKDIRIKYFKFESTAGKFAIPHGRPRFD